MLKYITNTLESVIKQNTYPLDFRTLIRVREMPTSIYILNSNTFFLRVNKKRAFKSSTKSSSLIIIQPKGG